MVTSNQMDELAHVFVTLFDAKHLHSPVLWKMFYREVEVSDCMQTLFRGNSLFVSRYKKLLLSRVSWSL